MTKVIVILVAGIFLTACGGNVNEQVERGVEKYKVLALEKTSATLITSYPASLEGVKDIDIRPKIDGYIDEVLVDEGQEVSEGQLLFRIFNPQYSQDMKGLKAAVETAKSAVEAAELQVTKTKPLVEKGIISAFELQNVEIALEARKSDLANAEARYSNAVTNVGYTQIKSPVNGVVGTLPFRLGSYVNSATSQPLTQVSDISVIHAYFSIGEKQQLDLMTSIEGNTFQEKIEKLPPVNLILSNGMQYEHSGKIKSFSGQVNKQTGAFRVRADFENPEKLLRSGASATIQIPQKLQNVIVIPQRSTFEMQDKRMTYVLEDNIVKAVPIITRPVPGGQLFVVDEGLAESDLVLIEGVGILPEGAEIEPEVVKLSEFLKEENK